MISKIVNGIKSYRDERRVRKEYSRWIAGQLKNIRLESAGDSNAIATAEHYSALLDAPSAVRPSGAVWKLARLLFFLLCFGAMLAMFYKHVGEAALHASVDVSEFSFVTNKQQKLVKPVLISAAMVDGLQDTKKFANGVIDLKPGSEDDLSLQSLSVSAGTEVGVIWTQGSTTFELSAPIGQSAGQLTLIQHPKGVGDLKRIDLTFDNFALVELLPRPAETLQLFATIPISRFRTISQVGLKPPSSTLRSGEIAYYDTQLVRRVGILDLLEFKTSSKEDLTLLSIDPDINSTLVTVSGTASLAVGGPSGKQNLLPTFFEWWQGKPAIAVVLGATFVLFSAFRAAVN